MSRIDITSAGGAPLSDGLLQTANPLDATLQVVTDNVGTNSTLLLSTDETQINSTLRIQTNSPELLDLEDTGTNNRFNINRVSQKINLDFASKPTDITTQVGTIRTAIDGTNLADVVKFQENGQVTFTERVKLESDSTVTTQTSSVIQSSTTNANLVIAPNGTGALVADIPDGTAAGGNARGVNAVDLQMGRNFIAEVASGASSAIVGGFANAASGPSSVTGGQSNSTAGQFAVSFGYTNSAGGQSSVALGQSNSASSNYSVVSGGQSNTASTNTHATVVGGQSNTASGAYSVTGGQNSIASGIRSFSFGEDARASASNSVALGGTSIRATGSYSTVLNGTAATSLGAYSLAQGYFAYSYLYGQTSFTGTVFSFGELGNCQQSNLVANRLSSLTTGGTTVLSLDGTGVTNLIIPNGSNRAWNVQVNWVAIVTTITGTATGITVGDVITSIDLLAFKRIGGVSSASAHTSTATKTMVTTPANYAACAIAFTAGASQEMALTFTGPTFVGGGSVTMRVVARIELAEVAF